ncbi:MAG TPA: class I SAM-dependent methyltransferase, partial [Planctomycetota bacterium]|nr:class I SAM-dependent methyltransferase [Planctomycetota bacterium]
LYVQADEAIHEDDHDLLREATLTKSLNGVLFARRSFLGTLDREIPEYYAQGLLRLYRNGQGQVAGDGMSCAFYTGIRPALLREQPRMFNYSRMGDRDEVLLRSRCRDTFHHSTEAAIEANVANEYTQNVAPFDAGAHPRAIRDFYLQPVGTPKKAPAEARPSTPATLAVLMGPGERENLAPFFWNFRNWTGDVVVQDDWTADGSAEVLEKVLYDLLGFRKSRVQILRAPLGGDFAAARNRLREAARGGWVLYADCDERWDESLVSNLPQLVAQLGRDRKIICGFPRANLLDGVLVNDVPDSEWTPEGLRAAIRKTSWPPRNADIQYRLLRREEAWGGKLHEIPARLSSHAGQVVALRDFWILHNKGLSRQEKQDRFYRSLGQERGMPLPALSAPSSQNLRESVLQEAIGRLPKGRLVVVETGTLRDPSPEARLGDGWSTYTIAQTLADRGVPGSKLYSIDISPECIDISKRTVAPELHPWVSWICGDAAETLRTLPTSRIDLLYLDSSDDPAQILSEFRSAQEKLAPHSVIVIDDTGSRQAGHEGKGSLAIPEARSLGWRVEPRENGRSHMTILSREVSRTEVPAALPEPVAAAAKKGWTWFTAETATR